MPTVTIYVLKHISFFCCMISNLCWMGDLICLAKSMDFNCTYCTNIYKSYIRVFVHTAK